MHIGRCSLLELGALHHPDDHLHGGAQVREALQQPELLLAGVEVPLLTEGLHGPEAHPQALELVVGRLGARWRVAFVLVLGQRERRDGRAALPWVDLRQGASARRVTSAGVSFRPNASKSRFWTVDRKFSGFGLSSNAFAIWQT